MLKKSILFLFLLCLLPLTAHAQQTTPFGLSWGMTQKQIEAQGVSLEQVEDGIFTAQKLPVELEWAETYALMIDKKLGLVRVMGYTGDILNDPQGQMGRRIYYRLKAELERSMVVMYSQENSSTTPGITPPAGQSFYTCLEEGPCNPWYTNFVNGDISAQIILEALDAEAGFVSVIYENSALVRQIKR